MKHDWIVIGNYGAANTGDEAMLAGLLDTVTAETPLSMCVVSKRGGPPKWAESSRAAWIPPQLTRVLPALWTARGLAMGGGTHFHDDYRTTRLVRHWWYLSRIVLVSAAAKAFGKRVVWLAVGFGPLDGAVTRAFARVALRLCDQMTVRDRASLKQVQRLVPGSAVTQSFDLAALLRRRIRPGSRGSRQRLGVSLIDITRTRAGSTVREHRLRESVAEGLQLVLDAVPTLDVSMLTLRGGSREDDVAVTRYVSGRVAARHPGRVAVVDYDESPHVMFEHVAECDYLLGARYHANVLAFLAGVPQLVIAYHRKCADLCEQIGLPSDACLDIETISATTIRDGVLRLVSSPSEFVSQISPEGASEQARLSLDLIRPRSVVRNQGTECVAS
jgi:polysaccharide pyruvyl transferase WcaK-like protein